MRTSNFANNRIYDLRGISISRYPATRQGFTGPEFSPLMSSAGLLKRYKSLEFTWEEYAAEYNSQIGCLKPDVVLSELSKLALKTGATEPIILCYESAKTLDRNPCHRRLVAAWLARELPGVHIPEWSKSAQ